MALRDIRNKHNVPLEKVPPGPFRHLLLFAILIAAAIGAAWYFHGDDGQMIAEKLCTQLAMPIGILWIAVMFLSYFSMMNGRRFLAFVALICWILLTVAGNPVASDRIVQSIEEPYLRTKPLEGEAFDTIVLLGGASDYTPFQQPELGTSGDRIAMAAEMYHAGKTQRIICTGTPIEVMNDRNSPGPAVLSRQLLQRLGVPDEAIETIDGRNTREEMQNLSELFAETEGRSIGLLTSAWHLPRALRLAEGEDLKFEPVPADFLSSGARFNALTVVPSSGALDKTTKVAKEYLARLVGQ